MSSRRLISILVLVLLSLAGFTSPSSNSAVSARPQQQTVIQLQPVLSGLNSPLYVTHARDGSNRLFIVEQPGRIQVLQPGASSPTQFLDITTRVLSGGERGLLGLAFHPQFASNGRFFVNYTRQPDGDTVIAEYGVSGNPNVASTNERIILTVNQPFANHNGGMIEFGPDRFLYIGMGDGGSANDPGNRAQNLNELLGKMLRIDIDGTQGGLQYRIPADNPFAGGAQGRDEIYAAGLRNPFRFSFDRITGELYAGDVGQNVIEEIDIITRGSNYGWRVLEGTRCTNNDPQLCQQAGSFTGPIAEYNHSGGRCSVTGGYVYRGSASTIPLGAYLYADFCTGEVFMLRNGTQTLLLNTPFNIASFGEDQAGELYVVGLGGTLHRIINPNPPPPPPATFRVTTALIRKRSNEKVIDPVTVRSNGKKFEVVINEDSAIPVAASQGASIFVNGVELNTEYTTNQAGTPIFIGKLKRSMLSQPGNLVIEVVRLDGGRSNQLTIQIVSG